MDFQSIVVEFVVDPTPLTEKERKRISEIIAYYKATGKRMPMTKSSTQNLVRTKSKKQVA